MKYFGELKIKINLEILKLVNFSNCCWFFALAWTRLSSKLIGRVNKELILSYLLTFAGGICPSSSQKDTQMTITRNLYTHIPYGACQIIHCKTKKEKLFQKKMLYRESTIYKQGACLTRNCLCPGLFCTSLPPSILCR